MKSKKTKIAVFGGSFDPVHFGHIDIVKNSERLFDRVIVVPSYISPFKTGELADDGAARYKLCKKVFESDKTEVSRYEISKKGVSYSVDTASYYKKKYADAELYWILGSEELIRLGGWRNMDKLKTLVTFFVVPRPGFAPTDALLKELKRNKIKIKFAKFTGLDISSTLIKIDRAFGADNKYVPSIVDDYAKKHGLFDVYGKYVGALYAYGLDDRRIRHTYRTAVRGAELAKLYGGSVRDAVSACILHDIAKAVDPAEYADKVDISDFPRPTAHAPIGAYIARRELGVSDEIARAIRLHSTADENMSLLDEIVYLADKTELGRTYKSLDKMLYLCKLDKNVAMLAALSEIGELESSDKCKLSERALAYYKKLCGDTVIPELPPRKMPDAAQSGLPAVRVGSKALRTAPDPKSKEMRAVPAERSKGMRVVPDRSKELRTVDDGIEKSFTRRAKTDALKASRTQFISTGDEIKDIAVASADALCLHKARDIDIISVNGKTIVADYFVIASVASTTAVKALTDYVEDRLKKQFDIDPSKRDVDKEWVALDYGGVIIHIFTDKTREFYNIERLWSDGSNVERYGD